MKRASVDCECCSKRDLDDDEVVCFEGYIVCLPCRAARGVEISDRRAREDAATLAILAEAARW